MLKKEDLIGAVVLSVELSNYDNRYDFSAGNIELKLVNGRSVHVRATSEGSELSVPFLEVSE